MASMSLRILSSAETRLSAGKACARTIADAILDRVMQRNHRFTLTGDSLRMQKPKTMKKEKNMDPS
ncbi:hypothetical protein O3301_16565 [Janthinobacterium sp. SUN211]|uniref:hypothetical protein n=1 Tax=Janthinobacterium sp. SUN211 TaxID=3014786 RepID=UPI002712C8D3|nr:hypothetical protein [Janthinobacterium sp. SUN211]MDO8050085.1 hypothetical protein [Janthinobacterium sp. SUN211]